MKVFALKTAAAGVRFLAAIAKVFADRKTDIILISCQGNEPSQDILDLAAKLQDRFKIKVIAGKMRRSAGGAFSFAGKLFTMLRYTVKTKVVVIDAYCMAVSIPKKRQGQTVVQLWHAPEAIKKFSLQITDTPAGYSKRTTGILCMHRNYDYILCPADATRPFFEEAFGYPESAFVKLGLPSLDRIGLMKHKKIYEKYPELSGEERRPLTVVYAPTFRDGEPVDAEGLAGAFNDAENVALVLKLHPLDTYEPTISSIIRDREFPLIDWYDIADIVITDYSGVAVEAAAAGVASYYYIYDIDSYKAKRGLNVDLREEAISKYAFTDANTLAAQVINDYKNVDHFVAAASRDDKTGLYDYEALKAFADKYLEVPLSGNTEKLAEFIAGLVKPI